MPKKEQKKMIKTKVAGAAKRKQTKKMVGKVGGDGHGHGSWGRGSWGHGSYGHGYGYGSGSGFGSGFAVGALTGVGTAALLSNAYNRPDTVYVQQPYYAPPYTQNYGYGCMTTFPNPNNYGLGNQVCVNNVTYRISRDQYGRNIWVVA